MLVEKFETQVKKTPNKHAIETEKVSYTYEYLNRFANKVARTIIKNKIKGYNLKEKAALLFEHGEEMILGMLSVLKAGKTYVPIDPNYPEKRAKYIMINAEIEYIITNDKNINIANKLKDKIDRDIPIININQIDKTLDDKNLNIPIKGNEVAYILYTSGSTGEPKGVMQTHENVLHFVKCYIKNLLITEKDRLTLFSSYCHDAAVMDIYSALLTGATLFPNDIRGQDNLELLFKWIYENKITIWHSVPTLYRYFISNIKGIIDSQYLRLIVLGGEVVLKYDIEEFKRKFPHARLYNLYGQTESSYNSGAFITASTNIENITLGNVNDNTEMFVIDDRGKGVDVSGIGEIVIRGSAIAPGYWKNKSMTEDSFRENLGLGRVYCTGDLGRLLPDGKIKFIGRKDSQAKVRGYRVELGEIESKLLKHTCIKETVVLAKENSKLETHLCAYIVCKKEVSDRELRVYLLEELPNYMLPSYFIRIDNIPKTTTGKTDRKALQNINYKIKANENYIPPRNETEQKLSKVWEEILGKEKIGIKDDFFHLGGNSLKGAKIASEIFKIFKKRIKLSVIFHKSNIEELAEFLRNTSFDLITEYPHLENVKKKDYYQTSLVQKRIYAINQVDKQSTNYNETKAYIIEGPFDKDKFDCAFKNLVKRHEALRTSFHIVNETVLQKIHKDFEIQIEYIKLDSNYDSSEGYIKNAINGFVRPFDLSSGLLIRAGVIELADLNILLLDMHHIIADGVSTSVIIKDMMDLYEGKKLSEVRIHYKEFVNWQNKLYEEGIIEEQEKYWLEEMKGELPVLNMPTDYQRSSLQNFKGDTLSFKINENLSKKINSLVTDIGVTKYIFLLSAFNILLAKYSGQEDIIIGTPVIGRTHPDLDDTVGMFVNSLVMRNAPKAEKNFREFLKEVTKRSLKAFENQDYDFGELVEKLNIQYSPNRNPLFDLMFSVQNFGMEFQDKRELKITEYSIKGRTAKFDLSVIINDDAEEITGFVEYKTELYKKQSIEMLIKHYENILGQVVENIDILIKEIECITEEERHEVLYRFNDTKREYPKHKTIKEVFEEEAEMAVEKIAIVSNGVELSYQELNQRANQLARVLRKKGITRDSIVPVLCDKSIETIVAMVAVIKAGGAYLPIDEEYPEARIRYLLEDSESAVLLGKKEAILKLNLTEISVEVVDLTDEEVEKESKENLTTINVPEDLAYVIYTSGTTGNPKGVCIENRSLIKIIKNTNYITIRKNDKLLQSGSLSFDASVQQIWLALLHGIPLHMEDKELMLEVDQLEEYILNNNITLIIFPTTLFNQISQDRIEAFEKIKYVIAGGDIISSQQVSRLVKTYKGIKVVNGYGPTENTIISTAYVITDEWDENKNVPIGKPITNSTVYIMDKHNKLLPIGVPGELCVGGDGVARGYLNREDLTNEKFILNPYVEGERIYKTGDLARWLPDGNLEFLGRIDQQVKIRGYRIELSEIEKQLEKHIAVKEAVVIDRKSENGGKYLCGYIVGEDNISIQELKEELKKELPDYMIPTYIMQLEKLPLTPNSKIDKKELPEPNLSSIENEYVAPRNEIEVNIAKVWCEVLGIEKVGIYNSFFDIGGDSIKSIQIVSRLRRNGIKLEVKDIMQHKTIAEIAKYAKHTETIISQEVVEGEIELTPIIKQFIETDKNIFNHFNQSMMFYSKDGFDEQIVKVVMEQIVKHHDALRMVLKYDEGISGYNKGIDTKLLDFHLVDLTGTKEYEQKVEEMAQKLQESIEVDAGPLVKVGLFKTSEGDHLLFIIHHLAVDGVSWRILLEDFIHGYQAVKEGNEIQFPQKTTSFKEWTEKQYEYANSSKILKELKYWEKVSKENLGQIPREVQNEPVVVKNMVTKNITLGKEITTQLLQETNRAYNTEINDILLSALGMAVKEWSGINKIAITLEGHGREEIIDDVDITRTVGWFTSCYPVVLNMEDKEIGTIIKRNKENLRRVPNKGIGYGMLKYLTKEGVNKGINLQTDISFNYLGQFDQDINSGLLFYSNLNKGSEMSPLMRLDQSIQINSLVESGRLKIKVEFNEKKYTKVIIEKFIQIFKAKLIETITYCAEKREMECTPTDYGINEYTIEDLDEIQAYVKENIGEDVNIKKVNMLTPMQEGMLFTYLNNRKTTAYIIQIPLAIEGVVNLETVKEACNILLRRYEVLRTIIFNHWRHPSQVVLDNIEVDVGYEEYSNLLRKEEAYTKYKERQISLGFDVSKDILFKVDVVKMDENNYRLLITVHHIILDGWSIAIILNEFFKIYEAIEKGKGFNLDEVFEYDTYIRWLLNQDKEEGIKYWKDYLENCNQKILLPKRNKLIIGYKEGLISSNLDVALTSKIEEFAKRTQVTLNTICQVVWGMLLQKYSDSNDVVFGSVVSGRPTEILGIEKIVGIFINTVPVRVHNEGSVTVKELIKNVQYQSNAGKRYEYLPLAEIQNLTNLKQDLIQNLIVFENYPIGKEKNDSEENDSYFRVEKFQSREQTNYDLNIAFTLEKELMFDIMYNENIYERELIEKFSKQIRMIFEAIVENEEKLVSDIEIIQPEEKDKIKCKFNQNKKKLDDFNGMEFSF
ncbi:non-ribosomal peptide synthetase [Bacillus cereus]|uniref:Amino acid adenylation domain-containing protein n=1 Tax=Bacillus cereus HuA2-1 TaxID=1053201 RepID=J9C8N9_BACCE|nr:non-ribosomal peptide synthetase [Bacillus cereus]EJV87811.1 amino acid adenylation domain-containing protein [Bacillus cereus HuA2-1]